MGRTGIPGQIHHSAKQGAPEIAVESFEQQHRSVLQALLITSAHFERMEFSSFSSLMVPQLPGAA